MSSESEIFNGRYSTAQVPVSATSGSVVCGGNIEEIVHIVLDPKTKP
jgi:hypothetical protein